MAERGEAKIDIDEVLGKLASGIGENELEPNERKELGKYKGNRRDRLMHSPVHTLKNKEIVEAYNMANDRRKAQLQAVIMLRSQTQMAEMNKALQEMNHRIQAQGGWLGKVVHYTFRTNKLLALLVELGDKKGDYGEAVREILKEKDTPPEK